MRWILRLLILGALVPSLLALLPRQQAETPGPVLIMIDGQALEAEALAAGETVWQRLVHYRDLGVRGVAVYEPSIRDLVNRGELAAASGSVLSLIYPSAGFLAGWNYLYDFPAGYLWPGAEKFPEHRVVAEGQEFRGYPLPLENLPAGPDQPRVLGFYQTGFFVAYRPFNNVLVDSLNRIPEPVDMLLFPGEEALGFPDQAEAAARENQIPVGWIEGAPQRGLGIWARQHPIYRVFSLDPDWQLTLAPLEVASKYLLAARERGHQVLYFRPFADPEETELFLSTLTAGLRDSGIAIAEPELVEFEPSPLASWAWLGIGAGLVLLILGYPWALGGSLALLLLALAFGYGGAQSGPLLAALIFPVLGFLEPVKGMWRWLAATAYSLAGAAFLAALGSTPETILGLEPFRGVLAVLVIPPALVGLTFLPRTGLIAKTKEFFGYRPNLLELGLIGVGLVGLAMIALRRGNDAPFVAEIELRLRAFLGEIMVRPRFKEIFGHAAAVVALTLPWPNWLRNSLLLLAVVAQASILDTFAHYHTPLEVSAWRTLNGILLGLILGAVVMLAIRRAKKWW